MPAKVGIQKCLKILDSRLRGNDAKRRFQMKKDKELHYETIDYKEYRQVCT